MKIGNDEYKFIYKKVRFNKELLLSKSIVYKGLRVSTYWKVFLRKNWAKYNNSTTTMPTKGYLQVS